MKAFLMVLAACGLAACSQSAPPSEPAPLPPVTQAPAATPPPTPAAPAVPATSVPERFQGAWASDATACTTAGHESRLVVASATLGFHESSGPVKDITVNGDDLTVTATLQGEGEVRDATYHFTLSDGGNTLTDRDAGMVRRRCDT